MITPEGLCFTSTADGLRLPVIDITHPAFAAPDAATLEAARARYLREMKLRALMPRFLREALVRFLVKRSTLLRLATVHRPGFNEHADASRVFMSGTATYLMKLPPELLGSEYAQPLDYKLARTFPPIGLRLRLHKMARLIADGVAEALQHRTHRPTRIELLNIGGGPAVDSWNAVLLLRKEHPELVAGKSFRIRVLDRDSAGPAFGASAVAALRGPDGPLRDVDVSLEHVPYDWSDTAPLKALLSRVVAGDEPVLVVSTEGALFGYGTDEAILANLRAIREGAPADVSVCGDFAPDNEVNRLSARETLLSLHLFSPSGFAELVGRAGFELAQPAHGGADTCVRLVPG